MGLLDKLSIRIKVSLIAAVGIIGMITYLGFANFLSNRSVQIVSEMQKRDLVVLEYVDLIWSNYATVKTLMVKDSKDPDVLEQISDSATLLGQYLRTIGKLDSEWQSTTDSIHFHFYQFFRKSQKLTSSDANELSPREREFLSKEVSNHLEQFETSYFKFSSNIYSHLDRKLRTIQQDNIQFWRIGLSIGVATILFLLFFSYTMGARISRALTFAIDVANKIQKNEWVEEIKVSTGDETGQLLSAIKKMHDGLKDVQQQLKADASFAAALNNIEEAEIYENSLATIAGALKLPAAALYLLTQDKLECRCHYTIDGFNLNEEHLDGNGFPTQVLLENRPLIIGEDNFSQGKLQLQSGVGTLTVNSIYGWPIYFQSTPVGVLVTSHLSELTREQESYLVSCMNQLGIRIYSLNLDAQRKELVDDLKRQSAELEKASQKAVQASQIKSHFLANMSHEIRTPMNSILGFTDLALQTDLNDVQKDYLGKAKNSCNALLNLINHILDFSKIEANKIELEKIPFNLCAQLETLVDLFSKQCSEKNIELLIYHNPDAPANLIGDPLRISQIFINLISNALKFTNQGNIKLKYHVQSLEGNKATLQFALSDTGIGIPQEQLDSIFQAFTQADESTTRRFGGTGLGLSICKSFAELMGGEIWAVSGDSGTTIYVVLQIELDKNQQKSTQDFEVIAGKKVLLLGEEPDTANLITQYLNHQHCAVKCVNSFTALQEHLAQEELTYDLLLVQERDTLRDRKELTSFPQLEKARLVRLLTYQQLNQSGDQLADQMDAWIGTPIKYSQLLHILSCVLDESGTANPITHMLPNASTNPTEKAMNTDNLSGLTILVADDTELNRELATCLLEDVGIEVIEAVDGKDAVEQFTAHQDEIDLIIMDVQMPEMDGYEATRAIRQLNKGESVPIIAMTANALAGDDNKCLDAGMNDYLPKPAGADQIYEKLNHWCTPKEKQPDEGVIEEPTENQSDAPTIVLNTEEALALVNGKMNLYLRMLANFSKHYSNVANDIQGMMDRGEVEEAARKAHSLKGVAGNIAAPVLQHVALQIETDLNNEMTDHIDQLLAELKDAVENVQAEAQKIA